MLKKFFKAIKDGITTIIDFFKDMVKKVKHSIEIVGDPTVDEEVRSAEATKIVNVCCVVVTLCVVAMAGAAIISILHPMNAVYEPAVKLSIPASVMFAAMKKGG